MSAGRLSIAAAALLVGSMIAPDAASHQPAALVPRPPVVQGEPTRRRGQQKRRRFKGWRGNPPQQPSRDAFRRQLVADLARSVRHGDANARTILGGYPDGDLLLSKVRDLIGPKDAAWFLPQSSVANSGGG